MGVQIKARPPPPILRSTQPIPAASPFRSQLVSMVVYISFPRLIGWQFLDAAKAYPGRELDLALPASTVLQFYAG